MTGNTSNTSAMKVKYLINDTVTSQTFLFVVGGCGCGCGGLMRLLLVTRV